MSSFTYSIPVQAEFAQLWTLVCDVRRVAQLFPFTAVDEFDTTAPDHWVFRRRVTIPSMAELCWREQSWAEAEGDLRFTAVEGDLQTFTGQWLVTPAAKGTKLTLTVDYIIPEEVRPRVPNSLVDYVMSELFKTICQRVKDAAEEDAA